MELPKYKFVFNASDVNKWKFCPLCGSEILEIYPGDYFGHISCFKGENTCDIDFDVFIEENNSILVRDSF